MVSESAGRKVGKLEAKGLLLAYIDTCRRQGSPIPANPHRPTLPAIKLIADQIGIEPYLLAGHKSALRGDLDDAIIELGLEVPLTPVSVGSELPTLEMVRAMQFAKEQVEHEKAQLIFRPRFERLERVFEVIAANHPQKMLAIASEAIDRLETLIAQGKTKNGAALLPDLAAIKATAVELQKNPGLPDDFGACLRLVIARSGVRPGTIATKAGMRKENLTRWCSGERTPQQSSLPQIETIEDLLSLDRGTLTGRIQGTRLSSSAIKIDMFPADIRGGNHRERRRIIVASMPIEFADMHETQQRAEISAINAQLEKRSAEKRKWYDLRQDSYKLPFADWPESLQNDFREMQNYKGGKPIINRRGDYVFAPKYWRDTSAYIYSKDLEYYFGYLVLIGVPVSELNLIMVAAIETIKEYFDWKVNRKMKHGNNRGITRTDTRLLSLAAATLDPNCGFIKITCAPSLVERAARHVRFARFSKSQFWDQAANEGEFSAFCEDCRRSLLAFESSYRTRDPGPVEHREKMRPLLSLKDPAVEIYSRLVAQQERVLRLKPGSRAFLRGIRNLFLVHIAMQTGFRAHTWVQLTYKNDQSGHLRRVDGRWCFVVPASLLKNGSSSADLKISGEFRRKLLDIYGCYRIIDAYIDQVRQSILGNKSSTVLFVNESNNFKYSENNINDYCRNVTKIYFGVSAGENRIGEIESFPVHAFRDIIATSILKSTRSYTMAADAICCSEENARKNYAYWLAIDREKYISNALLLASGEQDQSPEKALLLLPPPRDRDDKN